MNLRMNKNYQPVFIKTLLESTDYQASREEIISKLKESNQNRERDWGQTFWDVVNEVLSQKENLVEYSTETKVLKLLIDETLSNEEKLTLVKLCEKKILEIDILQGQGKLIDPIRFQKLHKKFLEHMKMKAQEMSIEPPNDEFTNFQHPYILEQEIKYKKQIFQKARKALSLEKWGEWKSEPSKIFLAVKNVCDTEVAGNLLTNPAQFGPNKKNKVGYATHKIFDQTDDKIINGLGKEFFNWFKGGDNSKEEFSIRYDSLIKFHKDNNIGLSSQIFAYLSFLLDPEQYIPIRISKFEPLASYYKCSLSKRPSSWIDYSALLDILEEVKSLLEDYGKPNTIEAHSYLWIVSDLIPKMGNTKYWLIKPGTGGSDWENQKEKGVAGVGWIGVDLLKFFKQNGDYVNDNSKKEFGIVLRERENVKETAAPNHMTQIQWFMQAQKGDKIVAWFNGTIHGIGEITGDYVYDKNEDHRHTKNVKWYNVNERKIPQDLYIKKQPVTHTFCEFPKHWKKWFFNEEDLEGSTIMSNENEEFHSIMDLLESKKQIVLYGPPGTGKTYFAKKLALQILGKNPDVEIENQFQALKNDGKVNLIQFHPSYSYEDFVQGIKPKNENGQITYEVRDGIFKKMCESLEETSDAGYEEHYFATVNKWEKIDEPFLDREVGIDIGQPGINKIDHKKFQKIFYKIEAQKQDVKSIDNTNFSKENSYFILRESSSSEDREYGDKTGIEYHFRPGIPGSTQLPDALADGKQVPFVYYDRERDGFFGIGVLKGLRVEKKPLGEPPKKVLIIDEINRGNLSKIFGELIYALEYRNESIDLQYREFDDETKGTLKIPDNLLIIGTMNTADRSIVLFDTAMRRRFAFVPMMPDYKYVLQKLSISKENMEDKIKAKLDDTTTEQKTKDILLSVLSVIKINSKLTTDEVLRLGRERQIGQSYLIGLIDGKVSFLNLWKYEIIPLLEEYYSSKIERMVELVGDIVDVTNGISDFDEIQLRDVLNDLIRQ